MGRARVLLGIVAAGSAAMCVSLSSGLARATEPSPSQSSAPAPSSEDDPLPTPAAALAGPGALPPAVVALPPPPIPWGAPGPGPATAPAEPAPTRPPPSAEDKWPIEYVLRPQTLPEGAIRPVLTADYFRPRAGVLYTPLGIPYTFHPNLLVGVSAGYGATDRLQLNVSAPRLLCFGGSQPNGCDDLDRANGSGVSLGYGLVRTRPFQLVASAGMSIWRSDPVTFAWNLGVRGKLLFRDVVALELEASARRPLDTGSAQDSYLQLTFVTDLNLQLTHHLLVFVDLDPYAPAGHLDAPALEGLAGVEWSFENRSDLGLRAGIYNLLADRSWQNSVPGSFYLLTFSVWL